jgi:hypothetical protein
VVNTVEAPKFAHRKHGFASSFWHLNAGTSAKEGEMPKLILRLTLTNVDSRYIPPKPPPPQPPPPNQLGDMYVVTDNIIEINGKTIAPGVSQHSGFCFRVRKPDTWLCQAGYTLPGIKKKHFRKGGQIEARGILDFTPGAPPGKVAITGGTGDYRRASGEVKFFDDTHWKLTIFTP